MYFFQHLKTVLTHKYLVMKGCFKVGLYWQGIIHDLSKFSWTEFSCGVKYWQGNRSPNNAEREAVGVSMSWLHHKGRNKHHFEYWIDYDLTSDKLIGGMPIPKKYVAEMIMDRIAASKVYMGNDYTDSAPYEYFMKSSGRLWFVHRDCRKQLEFLLHMLAEEGEEKTFRYIKHVFLKKNRKNKRRIHADTRRSKLPGKA